MNPTKSYTSSVILILDNLRSSLNKIGARAVRSLGKVFRTQPSYNFEFNTVSKADFFNALMSVGVSKDACNDQEGNILVNELTAADGNVNFTDFLMVIRGVPNSRRQAMIDKAF